MQSEVTLSEIQQTGQLHVIFCLGMGSTFPVHVYVTYIM